MQNPVDSPLTPVDQRQHARSDMLVAVFPNFINSGFATRLKIVILAPNVGIDQNVERRECRISNWPNCRITK